MKTSLNLLCLLGFFLILFVFRAKTNLISPSEADWDTMPQPNASSYTYMPAISSAVSTYIDEPILLDASETLAPSLSIGDEFLFEFDDISLVENGMYNDFDLAYWTSTSCDTVLWIFNYETGFWDQVDFSPPPGTVCFLVPTKQSHLFSAVQLEVHYYLNEDLEMQLRGDIDEPAIRALQINSNYLAVPIIVQGVHYFDGLAHDGQSLWVSSNTSDKLYEVSLSGIVLAEFTAPSRYPFGLAFDGQNLWLADGTDRIFKLNSGGNVLCHFSVPTDYPGGLTWDGSKLWLTEYSGFQRIFGIEPNESCDTGMAVLTDELRTPGGRSYGLAWNGTYLLVASDNLYQMTTSGEIVQVYSLPVAWVTDIAWNEEGVWLLNMGPKSVWGRDPVITKFRLRSFRIYFPLILHEN
jgi:hypothetical protein